MKRGHSILEHPADVGIEARGASLREAFEEAAIALVNLLLEPSVPAPSESRSLTITAPDQDQLLVRWLSEILYLCDGQAFVPTEFSIHGLTATNLTATVRGEPRSPKHHPRVDVKAITYHQLTLCADRNGASVRVFLDV